MEHYVYIIFSTGHNKYYRGYTGNPERRLEEHNSGFSRYTSDFLPWEMVYLEKMKDKTEALKRKKF